MRMDAASHSAGEKRRSDSSRSTALPLTDAGPPCRLKRPHNPCREVPTLPDSRLSATANAES